MKIKLLTDVDLDAPENGLAISLRHIREAIGTFGKLKVVPVLTER